MGRYGRLVGDRIKNDKRRFKMADKGTGKDDGKVEIINGKTLEDKIYLIRGRRVMLDYDLAEIYGYTTSAFNRQVKNNLAKFEGEDFMFQLDEKEFEILMCKNCTSSWGGTRKMPYAFTEQGVYMLMTVLRGELAVKQSRALIMIFKVGG